MRRPDLGSTVRWLPLLLFVATVAVLTRHFAGGQLPARPQDVEVVVTTAEAAAPVPAGDAPEGIVDAAAVDDLTFSFTGWADFSGGASLQLVTSGIDSLPDSRIRLRSLERPDVVAALGDRGLLYSGFVLRGEQATWGTPRCLLVRSGSGSRLLWKADGADCP